MTDHDHPSRSPSPQWAFPSKSRCPLCRSMTTVATSTQGPVQYRRCDDCGATYKVIGKEV